MWPIYSRLRTVHDCITRYEKIPYEELPSKYGFGRSLGPQRCWQTHSVTQTRGTLEPPESQSPHRPCLELKGKQTAIAR